MKRLTAGVAVAGLLIATPAPAGAHHPEVEALPGCIANGQASVFVTATAWQTGNPDHRVNNAVTLDRWDGAAWVPLGVGGQFTAANPSFVRQIVVPAPSAPTVARVRAIANVAWGVNENHGNAGEWRDAVVTITRLCTIAPPVTATPTTTKTPSTSTTAAPTTSVPVVTSSTVLERPPVLLEAPAAAAVVATPRFTG